MAGFLQGSSIVNKIQDHETKKHDSGQTAQGQPQAEQTVGQETDAQSPEGQDAAQEPDPQAELARQKDAYLRLYAEFDNYKKRSAREKG